MTAPLSSHKELLCTSLSIKITFTSISSMYFEDIATFLPLPFLPPYLSLTLNSKKKKRKKKKKKIYIYIHYIKEPKGQLSLYYPRTHTFCSAFSSLHPLLSSPPTKLQNFCTPLPVWLFVLFFIYTHTSFSLSLLTHAYSLCCIATHPSATLPSPILLNFHYLLLSATLLYFAATKQPFYTFAHLPLHHSSLTFYYAILLTSTILVYICYTFQLGNRKPSFYNFTHFLLYQATLTLYSMLYATSHNPSLSIYRQSPTSLL